MANNEKNIYENFDDAFPDGRMTEPSKGYIIKDLVGALKEVERLGRPLTKEEAKAFL